MHRRRYSAAAQQVTNTLRDRMKQTSPG